MSVHYTGTLDDGSTFDSSRGRDPLTFVVGAGTVVSGFDRLVTGLEVGGTRKARLEPAEAYGERSDEAVISVPASQAPRASKRATANRLPPSASLLAAPP